MNDDNLRTLAYDFNAQYVWAHSTYVSRKVDVTVIGSRKLNKKESSNTFSVPYRDTIVRVSSVHRASFQTEIEETKWEGSLDVWWQAVADSAKQIKGVTE